MKTKKTIIELHEGGTPHGITTIEEWVNGCSQKVYLNSQGEREQGSSLPLLTGTLLHALLEHYYKTQEAFDTDTISWKGADLTNPSWPAAEMKAVSAFREYRMHHAPDEWGAVLHTEFGFEINEHSVIGVAPFTGRIDLIVQVSKKSAKVLKRTRGVDIEPGIWVVDHKSTSGLNPNSVERHKLSLQGTAYTLAAEHVLKRPITGFLINLIEVAQTHRVFTLPVFPSVLAERRLLAVTQAKCMATWPSLENHRPNVSRCFDYNSVCPHWVSARCTGV